MESNCASLLGRIAFRNDSHDCPSTPLLIAAFAEQNYNNLKNATEISIELRPPLPFTMDNGDLMGSEGTGEARRGR